MLINNTGFDRTVSGSRPVGRQEKTGSRGKTEASSFADQLVSRSAQTKTDRIEISQRPVENRSALSEAKAEIRDGLQADTAPSRLETLKEQVGAGQYSISASEMARILIAVGR